MCHIHLLEQIFLLLLTNILWSNLLAATLIAYSHNPPLSVTNSVESRAFFSTQSFILDESDEADFLDDDNTTEVTTRHMHHRMRPRRSCSLSIFPCKSCHSAPRRTAPASAPTPYSPSLHAIATNPHTPCTYAVLRPDAVADDDDGDHTTDSPAEWVHTCSTFCCLSVCPSCCDYDVIVVIVIVVILSCDSALVSYIVDVQSSCTTIVRHIPIWSYENIKCIFKAHRSS